MKKVILSLMAVICSLSLWSQSSVIELGQSILECSSFSSAKQLLTSNGLTVDTADKEKTPDGALRHFSNNKNSAHHSLSGYIEHKGNNIISITFVFAGDGKYYNRLGYDMSNYRYRRESLARLENAMQEEHSNDNYFCVLTGYFNGKMELTLMHKLYD